MGTDFDSILSAVQDSAEKRILFLPHAIRQMSRPERLITRTDIRSVISGGVVIEDYPEDQRGHSCLLMGLDDQGRTIHIVCSPKNEYLAIITAYLPDAGEWSADLRSRK